MRKEVKKKSKINGVEREEWTTGQASERKKEKQVGLRESEGGERETDRQTEKQRKPQTCIDVGSRVQNARRVLLSEQEQ